MSSLEESIANLSRDNPELSKKFERLLQAIGRYDSALVAFSGGADSTLLAYLASRMLKGRMLAVTADSPSLPRNELSECGHLAKACGFSHRAIKHDELEVPEVARNDSMRCYYCKSGLFGNLDALRLEEGLQVLFDGSNADDLEDYRPGQRAVSECGVVSPLQEAGLSKSDIRELSRFLELPTWDKPQMACLSSRIPPGEEITREKLEMVEKAEEILRAAGFSQVRVRHHGPVARLELAAEEDISLEVLGRLVPELKGLGFLHVALDLEGYRMGSTNARTYRKE